MYLRSTFIFYAGFKFTELFFKIQNSRREDLYIRSYKEEIFSKYPRGMGASELYTVFSKRKRVPCLLNGCRNGN